MPKHLRPDLALVSDWIQPGSHVLDLGCGDGALLNHLREQRGASGYGVELDNANIVASIRNGVSVIQQDLDQGLQNFGDQSFDHVVMSLTLQATYYPDRLLLDMTRVGREAIVTFPNFGHWHTRWQLAFRGRMPVTEALPYQWYNTPNVRLCTIRDFEVFCQQIGVQILERRVLDRQHQQSWLNALAPNLFGEVALYRCARRR